MEFWFFMLGVNLLFPAIMLVAGKLFLASSPKNINWFIGYRTAMSMKNEDTWRFAHACAGKFWWKWGWASLIIAVVPMLFVIGQSEEAIATVALVIMCLLMIPILAVIPHTEIALRNTFDKHGNRKT